MTAESIAKALGGRKVGGGWMARCPAHEDREPSLSIQEADDGKVLIYCHAGCDQAQVIAALRWRGLWAEQVRPRGRSNGSQLRRAPNNKPNRGDAKHKKAALSIWQATLYRVPEIMTLGRLPGEGESDSRWRTSEVRHVGSDTLTPGF
jgi:hypothetical protein